MMCSVCSKFHENIFDAFEVIEQTQFSYVRSIAGAKRLRASTLIDITRVLLNRLTVSHATENSWSKMAVHACGTLSYFHYKITRVLAKISAHGEISAQCEQYPNSFKCTSIFSLFLCSQKDIQQKVWYVTSRSLIMVTSQRKVC